MVPSLEHERLKHTLATLVEVLAEEMGIDVDGVGSTTFNREDLEKRIRTRRLFLYSTGRSGGWIKTDRSHPRSTPGPGD